MSRKNGGASKLSYILIVVGVVLFFVFVCGFFAKFTNNFTSDFATFYVEHDGKTITADRGGYGFDRGVEYRFNVGYSLDVFNKEKLNYNVKVAPNITPETEFVFENDDYRYKFSDNDDLTAQFKITKHDGYFTLTADKLLNEVINSAYDGNFTGIPTVDGKLDYFTLIVSSEDGSKSINIAFNVSIPPEGLTSNAGHIIAG